MPAAYRVTAYGRIQAVADLDLHATPGIDPTEEPNGPVVFRLEVDGEQFAVRTRGPGQWSYDWLTGPNQGYGFGSSGPPVDRSVEEHQEDCHNFLSMIDPVTGYIEDE